MYHQNGYVIRFGGKLWIHDESLQQAFRVACECIERKFNGEPESELPF
jgi:hypothetical protein